jgi:hypothetical protein
MPGGLLVHRAKIEWWTQAYFRFLMTVQSAYWKRQTYFEGIVGSCIPGARVSLVMPVTSRPNN